MAGLVADDVAEILNGFAEVMSKLMIEQRHQQMAAQDLTLPQKGKRLKTLHKTCAWLLVALGTVHAALTPMLYGRFSLGALWLGATGPLTTRTGLRLRL